MRVDPCACLISVAQLDFTLLTLLSIQIHSIPKITNSHCAFKLLIVFQKSDLTLNFLGALSLYKAKPCCAYVSQQIPRTRDNMEMESL